MDIACIWEHNGNDTLLYARDFPGAFARGASLDEAIQKMPAEVRAYLAWLGEAAPADLSPVVVQEKASELHIRDADSDVLFDSERAPLTLPEYETLKSRALKSASDFLALYTSVPDKEASALPARETFYGAVPRTAEEMYLHTKQVNAYYFAEIDVPADNDGTILDCRRRGFAALEARADVLENAVLTGSYGEDWSVQKVLRRFLWHDRIHAKALWRMAERTFGAGAVPDAFCFAKGETRT